MTPRSTKALVPADFLSSAQVVIKKQELITIGSLPNSETLLRGSNTKKVLNRTSMPSNRYIHGVTANHKHASHPDRYIIIANKVMFATVWGKEL